MTGCRCRRRLGLVGLWCAVLALGSGVLAGAFADEPAPVWGHEEEVPPAGGAHSQPIAVAFPDGTLVAVWIHHDDRLENPPGLVRRSTRPPGGSWGEPESFPVPDVGRVNAVAAGRDGGVEIAYRDASIVRKAEQVRTWRADGSLGEVTLAANDPFDLQADAAGDVVATRLGRYDGDGGFDRVVRHLGEGGWQSLPTIGADPGDVFVAGPGGSVWMAGYDTDDTTLRVRRWTPGMARWDLEWSRDFHRRPQYKPLVQGLDLAIGSAGRAVLGFQQREVRDVGASVRAVQRTGTTGWSKPVVVEQLPAGQRLTASAPVVAAAGPLAAVAWSSTSTGHGFREINLASLMDGGVDRRQLGVTGFFEANRDLSLDVDLRADGDLLLTYLQRRGSREQVVAWVGAWNDLEVTVLLRDASVMRHDSAFLVPGLAAVVSGADGVRLVSFAQER